MHLRDKTHGALVTMSPLLTILRKAHSGTLAVSLVPWGQSTAVLSKAYTEEHPRRQSQVHCPSLGGSPSLAGEKKSQMNSLSQENSAKAQGKPEGKAFSADSPLQRCFTIFCAAVPWEAPL